MRPFLVLPVILIFASCAGLGPVKISPAEGRPDAAALQAEPAAPPGTDRSGENDTLIDCLLKASSDLAAALPEGAILAVIQITSADTFEGYFAEEELIYFLLENGKHRLVERRELDAVRREQYFQLSGDVDDQTAVSIGRMAGAGIVITGTILPYGTGKYLNLRALDVETARILAASSRPFAWSGF
jgi:hypothetical protein